MPPDEFVAIARAARREERLAPAFVLCLVVAIASFVAMVVCAAYSLVWEAVACASVCIVFMCVAWYIVPASS